MTSILLKQSKMLERQVDDFLDTISRGALVFRSGIQEYLEGMMENFEGSIEAIGKLENRADDLRRSVETQLYTHSLIPESRGDVLALLENIDEIINAEKKTLNQFSVEMPDIPEEYDKEYLMLTDVCVQSVETLISASRAFFMDFNMVTDRIGLLLHKVYFYEKEADTISDRLKRRIFRSDLELSRKNHLRYFALHIETISDLAENVADRLSISTIKRSF